MSYYIKIKKSLNTIDDDEYIYRLYFYKDNPTTTTPCDFTVSPVFLIKKEFNNAEEVANHLMKTLDKKDYY